MIDTGTRYQILPGLLLGFHGTDEKTANKILSGRSHLIPNDNDYDWLGHGVYFWEHSPQRAYQFAEEKFRRDGRKDKVSVIGAIIHPGLCFNLLEASALGYLGPAYETLLEDSGGIEKMPENGKQFWDRTLDCAVINMVHTMREEFELEPYDLVRGAFWEGGEAYPGARIEKKNHVQLCVRNPECIKGYFRPIENIKYV
jgi:hypothetical protein